MSELQFPKDPIVGQQYDFPPYKYYWDGTKWKTMGIGYNPVNDLRNELEPRIETSEKNIEDLSAQSFEALRRSYAEAGLNLVDGSFEEGGILTSSSDVLLHKATGRAFSGPAGAVAAGTNPASGGFVDRSGLLIGAGVVRNGKFSMRDFVSVRDFAATGEQFDGIDDNSASFLAAVSHCATTGKELIGDADMKIRLTSLPSPITASGFRADMRGAEFIVDMPSSTRGDAIFPFRGAYDSAIYATMTANSSGAVFTVDTPSKFAVGDFVLAIHTVPQSVANTVCSGVEFQFMSRIISIVGNDLILATERYYSLLAAPPAGGSLRLYKANPCRGFVVKNVKKRDTTRGGASTDHQLVSTYLCADYYLGDLSGKDANGTMLYHQFSHNYLSERVTNNFPTRVDAGRGYLEQHIGCTNAFTITPKGNKIRHLVDYSAMSTNCVIVSGIAISASASAYASHGSYESVIRLIDCEAIDSVFSMWAGSGSEFGSNSADIEIINPKGQKCQGLCLALTSGAMVSAIKIVNPKYSLHASTYSYAVEANMDSVSIVGGGCIDGGIKTYPTQQSGLAARTDLDIADVKLTPRSDNGVVLESLNMLTHEVKFNGCTIKGRFLKSSTKLRMSFHACSVEWLSNPVSGQAGGTLDIKSYGTTYRINSDVVFTAQPTKFISQGDTHVLNGFAMTYDLTPAAGGQVSIKNGDALPHYQVTGTSARITALGNDEGSGELSALPLLTVKGANNRVIFGENSLCNSTVARLAVDSGCTGLELNINGNMHATPFNLPAITYRAGVVTGNALLAGSQTVPATLTKGTNINYV